VLGCRTKEDIVNRYDLIGRFAVLFLSLGLVRSQAADLYVSPQGLDENPGTSAQPLRTITRAYSLAVPGTTIIVFPGVYTDHTSGWGLRLNKAGTASSPIVLRSQVRGGAVIDGQNVSTRNLGIYLDGSYHIVDGFEIKGGPMGGIKIWGSYNQILNNEIHHNGTVDGPGQIGIYSDKATQNNVYKGNYIHDNGRPAVNLDHGMYLCGDNEIVANNVIFRNATHGLQIAGYSTVSNMKVYNNVIAYNGRNGIVLWMSLSGIDIKNNILYGNGGYGISSWEAHGSGVAVDRNLSLGNASGDYDFTRGGSDYSYTLGTTISAGPLFVNSTSAAFDPHLRAGSPAIDAGAALALVTDDLEGSRRPQGTTWDIGAYEYGGTNLPPLMASLSFEAEAGQIVAPFAVSGGTVFQSTNTTNPSFGGAARYRFNITQSGEYILKAAVNAPNVNSNSFFLNIDAEPSDPVMIWDIIPSTAGIEQRVVSWRGDGTFDMPQFSPKSFALAAGEHTLTIRGREANTLIDRINIERLPAPQLELPPTVPTGFEIITNAP
jgi:hypothetical protein